MLPSLAKLRADEKDVCSKKFEWSDELPLILLLQNPHMYKQKSRWEDWKVYQLMLTYEQGANPTASGRVCQFDIINTVASVLFNFLMRGKDENTKIMLVSTMHDLAHREDNEYDLDVFPECKLAKDPNFTPLRWTKDESIKTRQAKAVEAAVEAKFNVAARVEEDMQAGRLDMYVEAFVALQDFFAEGRNQADRGELRSAWPGDKWRGRGNVDSDGEVYVNAAAMTFFLDYVQGLQFISDQEM